MRREMLDHRSDQHVRAATEEGRRRDDVAVDGHRDLEVMKGKEELMEVVVSREFETNTSLTRHLVSSHCVCRHPWSYLEVPGVPRDGNSS